jgi:hypothetical protein
VGDFSWGAGKRTRAAAIFACFVCVAQHCSLAQTTNSADRVDPAGETPKPAVNQPAFVPMTASQRIHHYFADTLDPLAFVRSAAGAGLGQWRDRPKEWHQGAEGFGKRYASGFSEHIVRQTLILGASSALHEDNRYIPSGQSGVGRRVKYAVANSFLARRDDGTQHFSYSRIGGFAGASLISRLWQPRSTRSFQSAGVNFSISMSVAVGFTVAREFLPQIFHRK